MAGRLTILLADDQVPGDTAAENERTKEEIRREFAVAKPEVDVDMAFADDFTWFTGLLSHLEAGSGERVIRVRTFEKAKQLINKPRDLGLDVAIVDLSWWGDDTLLQGAKYRENRGLELLEATRDYRPKVPIIALSQNFTHFGLFTKVLELGAFPVPKNYQERDLAYRALHAAAQYLTRERRRSQVEVFISHSHEDAELARRLVRAIEAGLKVPSDAIRCTSCPGYDVTPGTDYIEALKNELTGAACVVSLWTAQSLKSQWCLFELGAAWVAQKTLFLLQGADPPAGFHSIQASHLGDAGQFRRFLETLAAIIQRPITDLAAAERELNDLAKSG